MIATAFPRAKIMVLLRDPVARAFSGFYEERPTYRHPHMRHNKTTNDGHSFATFDEAVEVRGTRVV